jgi:hypothetical protein
MALEQNSENKEEGLNVFDNYNFEIFELMKNADGQKTPL